MPLPARYSSVFPGDAGADESHPLDFRPVPTLPIWPMALTPPGADPLPILGWRNSIMAGDSKDLLLQLSGALVSATTSAQSSVVAIRAPRSPPLSGTLWRNNLVVASEQVFPRADAAEIVQTDGAAIRARIAGRDAGTNIVALQLESPIESDRPGPADPALGALVLTFAADAQGAPLVRLGIVRSLGPAWHSRGGGRIDRRITLDLHLSGGEEGGPVVDAAGALLGMSTAPRACHPGFDCRSYPPAAHSDGAGCTRLARSRTLSGCVVRRRLSANRTRSRADGFAGS